MPEKPKFTYQKVVLADETPRHFAVAFTNTPQKRDGEFGEFWVLGFREKDTDPSQIHTIVLTETITERFRELLALDDDTSLHDHIFPQGEPYTMRLRSRRSESGKAETYTDIVSGWGDTPPTPTPPTDPPPPPQEADASPRDGSTTQGTARGTTVPHLASLMATCVHETLTALRATIPEHGFTSADLEKMGVSVFMAAMDHRIPALPTHHELLDDLRLLAALPQWDEKAQAKLGVLLGLARDGSLHGRELFVKVQSVRQTALGLLPHAGGG